jgi:hypothetical protein
VVHGDGTAGEQIGERWPAVGKVSAEFGDCRRVREFNGRSADPFGGRGEQVNGEHDRNP